MTDNFEWARFAGPTPLVSTDTFYACLVRQDAKDEQLVIKTYPVRGRVEAWTHGFRLLQDHQW